MRRSAVHSNHNADFFCFSFFEILKRKTNKHSKHISGKVTDLLKHLKLHLKKSSSGLSIPEVYICLNKSRPNKLCKITCVSNEKRHDLQVNLTKMSNFRKRRKLLNPKQDGYSGSLQVHTCIT